MRSVYRGITLAPVLSKLFEEVLLPICDDYLMCDNLQFGFRKQSSCAHALFIFTPAVKYFNSSGNTVNCAILDKAFDRILQYGLFAQLIEAFLTPFRVFFIYLFKTSRYMK